MNLTPPTYRGPFVARFQPLTNEARHDFERMATRLTLLPVVHGFQGHLSDWQKVRQALRQAICPTRPAALAEQGRLLKRFRLLERYRVRYSLREMFSKRFASEAHWHVLLSQNVSDFNRYTRWQRHAVFAHWSVPALQALMKDVLPYFTHYLAQAKQAFARQGATLPDEVRHEFEAHLTRFEKWLSWLQDTLAHAVLARLQCAARTKGRHADCLVALLEEAVGRGYRCPQAAHLVADTYFDARVLHDFSRYLRQIPSMKEELAALPWFAPHPDWQVVTNTKGTYHLPVGLERQLSASQPRRAFFNWFTTGARLASSWCYGKFPQSVWLNQRLLATQAMAWATSNDCAQTWQRYQEQQQRLSLLLRHLTLVLPSRWNWFYRHSRAVLLHARQSLSTYQQNNRQVLLQVVSQWLNVLEKTLPQELDLDTMPLADIESFLQQCTQACAPEELTDIQTLQARVTRWRQLLAHRERQQQIEHSVSQVAASPVKALAHWALLWQQVTRWQQCGETSSIEALSRRVQDACQALGAHVMVHLPRDLTTTQELAPGYPLAWVSQLVFTLGDASLRERLQTVLSEHLMLVCKDACLPLDEQRGTAWRRAQLRWLGDCPEFQHRAIAERFLELSQTHHAQFVIHARDWVNALDARVLQQQQCSALTQWKKVLGEKLFDTFHWKASTVMLFFDCCDRMVRGEAFPLIMAQTRRKIDWFAHEGLAKRLLSFTVYAQRALEDPQLKDQSLMMQAQLKRSLQVQARQQLPGVSFFQTAPQTYRDAITPAQDEKVVVDKHFQAGVNR